MYKIDVLPVPETIIRQGNISPYPNIGFLQMMSFLVIKRAMIRSEKCFYQMLLFQNEDTGRMEYGKNNLATLRMNKQ